MKILFFIIDLNSGGAEWQLARLAEALPKQDFIVKIVSMYGRGEVFNFLKNQQISVECLDYERPCHIWKLVKFVRIIRQFKPDVLHTWMFHANLLGKIIGKLCGVQNIIASLRVAEKERPYHVTLERWTSFLNTKILCNSKGLEDFTKQQGFPFAKLIVIPNSFDNKNFSFTKRKIPKDGNWKILYLGRISKQKGPSYLIDAANILAPKNIPFHIDIVGAEDNNLLFKNLKSEIKNLKLENNISISPPLPHSEIPALMERYHLLILPSLWEGMPNVIMEAFASGLPVIATNIEGSSDLVKDGITGLLAKPADSESLSEKIVSAISHYEEMREMARRAYDYLVKNHSPEIIHEKFIDLYRKK